MQDALPNILEQMGIDPEEFSWRQLAACDGYPFELFFDEYEKDLVIAKNVDQLRLGCPVTRECYQFGVRTKSTGVFGGIYLIAGEPSRVRNAHKTQEIAMKLAQKVTSD